MHLTHESLSRLLAGTCGAGEARALAAHLSTDCAQCEGLLASAQEDPATPLDGLADRALAALADPRPEEAGHDLEFARIERALRSGGSTVASPTGATPPSTASPTSVSSSARATGRSPLSRLVPFATAAALLVAAGLGIKAGVELTQRGAWDGVKGTAPGADAASGGADPATVPLRLSAVAVLAEGAAAPRVWKVGQGDTVTCQASLQLRVEVVGAASAVEVVVARAGPEGVEPIWRDRASGPGTRQPVVDGAPAGYPLDELRGRQRFLALASATPLTQARIEAAARALAAPPSQRSGAALAGISADSLEVTVEEAPGHE